jgi:catechol 2,3-dioxygenase-like lactoylglutathione lyase family enzyme
VLNHTIIRASNKERSARFFADLLGLDVGTPTPPFVRVHVNDHLTFDFDDRHDFVLGHYGFLVDDATFDRVLQRLRGSKIVFGSDRGPEGKDRQINHLGGGRGVYVQDPDGNSYEFFTTDPATRHPHPPATARV